MRALSGPEPILRLKAPAPLRLTTNRAPGRAFVVAERHGPIGGERAGVFLIFGIGQRLEREGGIGGARRKA